MTRDERTAYIMAAGAEGRSADIMIQRDIEEREEDGWIKHRCTAVRILDRGVPVSEFDPDDLDQAERLT